MDGETAVAMRTASWVRARASWSGRGRPSPTSPMSGFARTRSGRGVAYSGRGAHRRHPGARATQRARPCSRTLASIPLRERLRGQLDAGAVRCRSPGRCAKAYRARPRLRAGGRRGAGTALRICRPRSCAQIETLEAGAAVGTTRRAARRRALPSPAEVRSWLWRSSPWRCCSTPGADDTAGPTHHAPNSVAVIDPATDRIVAAFRSGPMRSSVAVGEGSVRAPTRTTRIGSQIDVPRLRVEIPWRQSWCRPISLPAGRGLGWSGREAAAPGRRTFVPMADADATRRRRGAWRWPWPVRQGRRDCWSAPRSWRLRRRGRSTATARLVLRRCDVRPPTVRLSALSLVGRSATASGSRPATTRSCG